MLLVSGRETADRVAQHKSAVDAAVDAGVQRIISRRVTERHLYACERAL